MWLRKFAVFVTEMEVIYRFIVELMRQYFNLKDNLEISCINDSLCSIIVYILYPPVAIRQVSNTDAVSEDNEDCCSQNRNRRNLG